MGWGREMGPYFERFLSGFFPFIPSLCCTVAVNILAWRYTSPLAIISAQCSPVVVIFDLSRVPLPRTSRLPHGGSDSLLPMTQWYDNPNRLLFKTPPPEGGAAPRLFGAPGAGRNLIFLRVFYQSGPKIFRLRQAHGPFWEARGGGPKKKKKEA